MTENELKLIKKAILNEVEGYEFYKLAAQGTSNQETADTFMLLAREEEKHVEWLQGLLAELSDDKNAAFELASIDMPPSPEIFRWDKIQEEDAHRALTVFSIGLQMEKASAEFYEAGAKQAENEKVKKLFDILAKWEWAHYTQFLQEYEILMDMYWDEQGYAPF